MLDAPLLTSVICLLPPLMPLVVTLGPFMMVRPVPPRVDDPVVTLPLLPSRVMALSPVPTVTLSAVSLVSIFTVMMPLSSISVVRLSVL